MPLSPILLEELNLAHIATNWNEPTDSYTQTFLEQNIKQFWVPEEIGISKDNKHWDAMTDDEKDVLKKALVGLTLLDTEQGNVGMPKIAEAVEDGQRKALLNFMAMMENAVHAKSYSNIFTTLLEKYEILDLFEWSNEERHLQYKAEKVTDYYKKATESNKDLYLAMVASVYLESLLFYSGFFYPIYLSGQGRMMATGDLISLIMRDENIHGLAIGIYAQEVYQELTVNEQVEVDQESEELLNDLLENEFQYTHEVYAKIDLAHEVIDFVKYNANKALSNLGKPDKYPGVEINPIVEAGLNSGTKAHDFFSTKGNGYIKAQIEDLQDEDFNF